MWEMEQAALRDIVNELQPKRILDFACGTGRISALVEKLAPQAQITGIDISESMLTLARQNAQRTDYRLLDTQQAIKTFGAGGFDLVMAFRFFPNAEASLRQRIGTDLGQLVAEGGSLVINNHRNFWSTSYIARRLKGEAPNGALNSDIERIFIDQGFRVTRKMSLGWWPQGDKHAVLLPWKVVGSLERANLKWGSRLHSLGFNTIWVLTKPTIRNAG